MRDLTKLTLEPRTAIMAVAEVVWEDQLGAWRGAAARIEDTSRSGACIRVSVPINVGAKLKIKWHREKFSGVAKYCRRDGGDYVLGIQRETSENDVRATELFNHATTSLSMPSSTSIQGAPAQQEKIVQELPKTVPEPAFAPFAAKTVAPPVPAETLPNVAHECETANKSTPAGDPGPKQAPESQAYRRTEIQVQEPSKGQVRTTVFNKLLHLGSGRQQQIAPDGNTGNTKAQEKINDAKLLE